MSPGVGARGPGFDLYLIVDGSTSQLNAAERVLSQLGGPRIAVQLRMKGAQAHRVEAARERLRAATRAVGSLLLLNGVPDQGLSPDVDGVQLPSQRPVPAVWRRTLAPHMRVGISCHNAAEIALAEAEGADFVLLSPFEAVPGKAPPLGPEGFARLAAGCRVPVVALGGIGPNNAGRALKAGADAVAVIRSVLTADDPAQAAKATLSALDTARAAGSAKTRT